MSLHVSVTQSCLNMLCSQLSRKYARRLSINKEVIALMPTYPKNLAGSLLFIRIWLLITLLTPLIRMFKLPRLLQLLTPKKVTPKRWAVDQIVSFTDTIMEQEKFIYRRNCLKRTLTLYFFFSRLGLPIQVNLGVRKEDKKLAGHGWLTLEGKPYKEPTPNKPAYKIIYSFPQLSG